jgi:tetratricopeptide (TPR) repeat protein
VRSRSYSAVLARFNRVRPLLTPVSARHIVVIAMLSMLAPVVAPAQSAPVVDTIAEATRLRDAKNFSGAATLLRPYADAHPDDAGTARFAALMTYWAKDYSLADSVYARTLARHPDDAALRLEYARFLLETSSITRAREVLAPMLAPEAMSYTPAEVARARTLRGTADYWSGDFTGARREFATALRLDTSVTDARRQLTEIETAAASWIRLGSAIWDDDQPLRHATFEIEGGWFASPLTPLVVRAGSTIFDQNQTTETISTAEAELKTYLPGARVDFAVGGGLVQRSFGEASDWTASATLGGRLPHTIKLYATFEREPYTRTVRSLGTAIMVRSIEGGARWGTPGTWMGELIARRETYPDDNTASTAYAWILAPLLRRRTATVHAGYGFSSQSADENRFTPRGDINVPPGQAPITVPGEYNPYYTPKDLRVHSALASMRVHPGGRWTLEGNARYALSARDEAPVLVGEASPPNVVVTRGFYERSFTPWNARGSLDWAATESVRLGLGAEHGRGAYYEFTTARVQLTYTFVAAARRRADVH